MRIPALRTVTLKLMLGLVQGGVGWAASTCSLLRQQGDLQDTDASPARWRGAALGCRKLRLWRFLFGRALISTSSVWCQAALWRNSEAPVEGQPMPCASLGLKVAHVYLCP